MSIENEIASIRQGISQLQAKLEVLETRLLDDRWSIKNSRHSSPNSIWVSQSSGSQSKQRKPNLSAHNGDGQTLRSQSFQVMRHLIHVVDTSVVNRLNQQPCKPDKEQRQYLSKSTLSQITVLANDSRKQPTAPITTTTKRQQSIIQIPDSSKSIPVQRKRNNIVSVKPFKAIPYSA
jgi:hypothetical protein